ncbi:MAG: M28 family peptidase, partial [Chloroflexia bacterium]|nr:M28 family peptidase [Chloroflexia bacterium]
MYKFVFIPFLFFHFIACKPSQQVQFNGATDTVITDEEITQIIDTISSDYYEGRGFGTEGIEKAAVFIENYLKELKIKPYYETYRDSFEVGGLIGYNIIGLIEGTDSLLKKEFVILSAHYDHVGKIKSDTDSIRNGANDNGTGVSSVLNIVKLLIDNKLSKRSIIVALFSGEEIGLTGSEHFSKRIKDEQKDLYCCVNIDMIGSEVTDQPKKVYLSGDTYSNMRKIFNNYIGSEEVVNYKKGFFDVFRLSDNYPIYSNLNIPSHTFCTFDFRNYEHYHKVSDEIQNVDLENTGIIVRNIAKGFIELLNKQEKEIQLNDL